MPDNLADGMEDVPCGLCGARDERFLYPVRDKTGGPGDFRAVRCRVCGLVYINPRPGRELKLPYYDSDYPFADAGQVRPIDFYQPMIDFLKRRTPGRLLDVGTGNSPFLPVMERLGWQVEGTEIDQQLASELSARKRIEVFAGELEDAGYDDGAFDAVTVIGVLEHVPDPVRLLQEARRILRPEGVLGLWCFNRSLEARLLRGSWLGFDAPRHLYSFSRPVLQHMLEKSGFKVLRVMHAPAVSYLSYSIDRLLKQARRKEKSRQESYSFGLPAPLQFLDRLTGRLLVVTRSSSNIFLFCERT